MILLLKLHKTKLSTRFTIISQWRFHRSPHDRMNLIMHWIEQMLYCGFQQARHRFSSSRIFDAISSLFLLILLLTAFIDVAVSQEATEWQLPRGVTYLHSVRKEPRPLHIHVLTIDLRTEGLTFIVSPGKDPDGDGPAEAVLTPPDQLAQDAKAVAAINTAAWEMLPDLETGKKPGYIVGGWANILGWVQNGEQVISKPQAGYWSVWMDESRNVFIGQIASVEKRKEEAPGARWAVSGFRGILADGKVLVEPSEVRHPRTAVGVTSDRRTFVWIVVDGRQIGYSEGVSEEELARLLLEHDCAHGINLDGGGSSSMWLRNTKSELSTANRPSEQTGPRPVPVVLNLLERKDDQTAK